MPSGVKKSAESQKSRSRLRKVRVVSKKFASPQIRPSRRNPLFPESEVAEVGSTVIGLESLIKQSKTYAQVHVSRQQCERQKCERHSAKPEVRMPTVRKSSQQCEWDKSAKVKCAKVRSANATLVQSDKTPKMIQIVRSRCFCLQDGVRFFFFFFKENSLSQSLSFSLGLGLR